MTETATKCPSSIRDERRFVLWKYEHGTKVPYQPNGRKAKSNDPSTWSTLNDVEAVRDQYDGIGLVLSDGYAGIDCDNCRNDFGEISPWAQEIIDNSGSYAEISPSGTGVKIFCRTETPVPGNVTHIVDADAGQKIEVHSRQYYTLTGDRISDADDIEFSDEPLRLYRQFKGESRSSVTVDSEQLADRCREAVAAMPEAIEGQGGHDATFAVACEIWRHGLIYDQAWDVINEFNERCVPAWSDEELEHKLSSARSRSLASGEFGQKAAVEFSAVTEAADDRFPILFAPEDWADDDTTVDFIIPGVLAAKQNTLVHGPPKALKTSLMLDQAVSIGSGADFLGQYPAEQSGPVFVFSGETNPAVLKRNLKTICEAKGVEPKKCNVYLADRIFAFDDIECQQWLTEQIQQRGAIAVYCDPAYLMMGKASDKMGNLAAVGPVLRGIESAVTKAGATPIVLHHIGKGRMSNKAPELQDASQAGFAEWAAQWFGIGRISPFNPGAPQNVHELAINIGGRAGHSDEICVTVNEGNFSDPIIGARWEVAVESAEAVRRRDMSAEVEDEQALYESMRAEVMGTEGGVTVRSLRDRLGRKKLTDRAIARLKQDSDFSVEDVKARNGKMCEGIVYKPEAPE